VAATYSVAWQSPLPLTGPSTINKNITSSPRVITKPSLGVRRRFFIHEELLTRKSHQHVKPVKLRHHFHGDAPSQPFDHNSVVQIFIFLYFETNVVYSLFYRVWYRATFGEYSWDIIFGLGFISRFQIVFPLSLEQIVFIQHIFYDNGDLLKLF
jgi:hypothetical protein